MDVTATPPRVTLFGHWICPYSVRVSFALAERRIAHDVVEVPPTAVRPKGFVVPRQFVDHSPKGEIPMVRVGDTYRADSLPILEWLETCVSGRPLLPADDDRRARVRERVAWIDAHVFGPMIGIYYGTRTDRIARASDALEAALGEMGDWLDAGPWLAGETPTLAEAAAVPVWVRLEALARLGFTGRVDERVATHVDRCRDLEGWAHVAWSDAQTDELVGRSEHHRAIVRGDLG
jgi:glutathione S-transferase